MRVVGGATCAIAVGTEEEAVEGRKCSAENSVRSGFGRRVWCDGRLDRGALDLWCGLWWRG